MANLLQSGPLGFPYKGSKNTIARKIIEFFPKRDNFYDLCCGGCAVTHIALLQNKFKHYYINDIEKDLPQTFIKMLNGEFNDRYKQWISREDYLALKDIDCYVRFIWSFGNNGREYLYSRKSEQFKKAIHFVLCNNDDSLIKDFGIDIPTDLLNELYSKEKRIKVCHIITDYVKKGKVKNPNLEVRQQHLEAEESPFFCLSDTFRGVEHLERVDSPVNSLLREGYDTSNISATNCDYRDVKIKENSLIYIDLPYKGTNSYGKKNKNTFDYDEFYEWCGKQTEPLIISEYEMPKDKFVEIYRVKKASLMCATKNGSCIEKLFIPKHQIELFDKLKNSV